MIFHKRVLMTLLMLAITTVSSYAQFRWGAHTGFQYSNLYLNKNSDRIKVGEWNPALVMPGLFFEYQFNKRITISSEVQFSNKGYRLTTAQLINGKNEQVNTIYRFPYYNEYLLFHFMPVNSFSVFAGPEVGVKFNARIETNGEILQEDTYYSNGLDFGLAGGISYQPTPQYRIMLRYVHGLMSVGGESARYYANPYYVSVSEDKYTNRSIQLSVNSVFLIPKRGDNSIVTFGLRQGISTFTLRKADNDDRPIYTSQRKSRIGYEAGLDMRFNIKKYFYLSTGLSFLQKGGSVNGEGSVSLDYLSVPLIAGISPVKTELITLSLEGGLGVNKQLKSKNPYDVPHRFPNDISKVNASSFYGFEVATDEIEKLTLFLNYRKTVDIGSFFSHDNGPPNSYTYYYTKGQSFSLGVRYRNERSDHAERSRPDYNDYAGNVSSLGVKGGVNLSQMHYSNQPSTESSTSKIDFGSHVGMYFKIKLGRRTSLMPELQYIRKHDHITAIEHPVMLSYSFSKRIDIEAGPQIGVLSDSKTRKIGLYEESISRPIDVGWNAGIRFNITTRLSVSGRYYNGMTDVVSWYKDGLRSSAEGYNRNFQVSTYFRLIKFSKDS